MSVAEPEPNLPEDDGGTGGNSGDGSGGGLSQWGRLGGIAAASTMAVVFAVAAWYALQRPDLAALTTFEVPLVKAELGPVKERPKDPGGLKIPNQDKLVYERITPKAKASVKEKLAPAPEEPIVKVAEAHNELPKETPKIAPKPAVPKLGPKADIGVMKPVEMPKAEAKPDPIPPPPVKSAVQLPEAPKAVQKVTAAPRQAPKLSAKQLVAKSSVASGAESLLPAGKPVTPGAPEKTAEKAVVKAPAKAPETKAVMTAPEVKKSPKVMPPKDKSAAAAKVSRPGYRIQFASFRTAAKAKSAWAKIKKAHGAIVDGLPPHTRRADLGQRGVYFRVQAGNFKTARAARQICVKLKAKRQDCIIVVSKKK